MNAESTREALDVASLAGDILLASGAEIFRVEETIDRIARAYGVKSSDAFVLSSGIFLTAESGKKQEFARVRHIPLSAARLDKVTAVNQLFREIEEGLHNISGGALVTLIAVFLYQAGIGHHLDKVIIGSIIPLVPGVNFTNAIRDIADQDYIAGSVRMLDALLVTFCIALGVGLIITGYHQLAVIQFV